jgi:hypothetical protein
MPPRLKINGVFLRCTSVEDAHLVKSVWRRPQSLKWKEDGGVAGKSIAQAHATEEESDSRIRRRLRLVATKLGDTRMGVGKGYNGTFAIPENKANSPICVLRHNYDLDMTRPQSSRWGRRYPQAQTKQAAHDVRTGPVYTVYWRLADYADNHKRQAANICSMASKACSVQWVVSAAPFPQRSWLFRLKHAIDGNTAEPTAGTCGRFAVRLSLDSSG